MASYQTTAKKLQASKKRGQVLIIHIYNFYGVFSKANDGGKWKLSGSRGGFDAGARRTAPEGGRGPQAF
jgi:hypothetical protein